ncbi:protease inhibitor I42 family protein [Chloroflexota bacterium]
MATNNALAQEGGAMQSLTEADNGSTIQVAVGEVFEVVLPANPSTGYMWEQLHLAPAMELIAPLSNQSFAASSDTMGAGGELRMPFVALGAGETVLFLSYHRSFEADVAAEATWQVSVVIVPPTLTEADNEGALAIQTGEVFDVLLPTDPADDNQWIVINTGAVLAQAGDTEFVPDTNAPNGVGYDRLRFTGVQAGEQLLILNYIHPQLADASADNAFRATVTVNAPPPPLAEADNEGTVTVQAGDSVTVVLPSDPSDANQWLFIDTGAGVLAQVMNTAFTADPNAPNSMGTEALNFITLQAGEQLLILNYIDPQLADAPADNAFRATVIAEAAGAATAPPAASTDPLAGTSWVAESLNGQPLVADSQITAEFADGQMAGKASCNNYFTAYTVDDSSFSVGMAGSTMMACPEPIMQQEQAFFGALESVRNFQISDGQLILSDEAGNEVLRFKAA